MNKISIKTMEKFDRMINDAVEDLDWRMIISFYQKLDLPWYGKDRLRKNSLEKRKPTIEELQNELKTVCRFVMEKELTGYVYEYWTIFFLDPGNYDTEEFNSRDDFGCQLEIIFSPTRSLSFEKSFEDYIEEDQITQNEMEIAILEGFLQKAIKKERYEMASKFRDKLTELRAEQVIHQNNKS